MTTAPFQARERLHQELLRQLQPPDTFGGSNWRGRLAHDHAEASEEPARLSLHGEERLPPPQQQY